MSSPENKKDSKAEIGQVEDVLYYCSDTSDTDTYYSEEEIVCGFVRDTYSSSESDSDRGISDGATKCQFPVKGIDFHGVERELLKLNNKQKDTLQIYPESHRKHLQDHHPEILKSLDALHKEGATGAYVSPSVAEDLQPNSTRPPRDVVYDVCIFNPQKPVMILTFTSTDELSSKLMRHNSKAARAFRGVDASSMMQKEYNPHSLSIDASPKLAYFEEYHGYAQKPDDIKENNNIYVIATHQDSKESDTSSRKHVSDNHISPSFDVRHELMQHYPKYQNQNNNKIEDARSKQVNGYDKSENKSNYLTLNRPESKQHTVISGWSPIYESNHANGISPVQRTNQVSSDATHVHNGQTELCLKGGIPQNVSVTKENLQQVNRHSEEDTSVFLNVDHDVLRDISVVSAALIEDEWKNPEAFLEKVKGVETLAREVELLESLEMDRERYARVLKSFFSRLSAVHKIHTSSPT